MSVPSVSASRTLPSPSSPPDLVSLIKEGRYDKAVRLVRSGQVPFETPLLTYVVRYHCTLHNRLERELIPLIKALIKACPSPEQLNQRNAISALHTAARFGEEEVVGLLLDAGADPNVEDVLLGNTPLSWILFDANSWDYHDVFVIESSLRESPDAYRIRYCDRSLRIAKRLVDAGADVCHVNHDGETVLMNATAWLHKKPPSYYEYLELLVAHGADPTAVLERLGREMGDREHKEAVRQAFEQGKAKLRERVEYARASLTPAPKRHHSSKESGSKASE